MQSLLLQCLNITYVLPIKVFSTELNTETHMYCNMAGIRVLVKTSEFHPLLVLSDEG